MFHLSQAVALVRDVSYPTGLACMLDAATTPSDVGNVTFQEQDAGMTKTPSLPAGELTPGQVMRAGGWAVGNREGELFAVSRRCRHQLADLSEGSIDPDGCLVCPWHQARYDVTTGAMVEGPKGFFGYHGHTPGYTQLVRAYGKVLRLRVAQAVRLGAEVVVRRSAK